MTESVKAIVQNIDSLRRELAELLEAHKNDEELLDSKIKLWVKRVYSQLVGWGFGSEAEKGFGKNSIIIMYDGVTRRAKMRDDALLALRDDLSAHPDHYQAIISAAQGLPAPPVSGSRKIFLGHGHDAIWSRVDMYLSKELHLNVEAWESNPRTGLHAIDVLKRLLSSCSFAVIVAVGEDLTEAGSSRARQNVLHEIGLFQ
jgi:hypothetical protein